MPRIIIPRRLETKPSDLPADLKILGSLILMRKFAVCRKRTKQLYTIRVQKYILVQYSLFSTEVGRHENILSLIPFPSCLK